MIKFIRLAECFSIDEIRAISRDDARGVEVILLPQRTRYTFDPASTEDDDGVDVLAPLDAERGCCSPESGRWLGCKCEGEAVASPSTDSALDGDQVIYDGDELMSLTTDSTPLDDDLEINHSVSFVVPEGGRKVFFSALATDLYDGFFRSDAQLGFRLTAQDTSFVDYYGTWHSSGGLGQGMIGTVGVVRMLNLAAGSWTVNLVAKGISTPGRLYRSAEFPAVLIFWFGS